jgi:hypothetical protein
VEQMLWIVVVGLLSLWTLGVVTTYTLAGFIHVLLVLAIVLVSIRVVLGRGPVI